MNEKDKGTGIRELKDSLLTFYRKNPLIGFIGSVASVIGLLLTVYFYFAAREIPDLTYIEHPAKTTIFHTGEASRIGVTIDNKPVSTNISAVQIAFWNAGKRTIKAANILIPFLIETDNQIPILEARIIKTSRDVIKLVIDDSQMDKGKIRVNWNLLEEGDGGVLQLIYAGDENVKLTPNVVIEGQRGLSVLKYKGEVQSPSLQYEKENRRNLFAGYSLLSFGIIIMLIFSRTIYKDYRNYGGTVPAVRVFLFLSVALIVAGIYYILQFKSHLPPFGF